MDAVLVPPVLPRQVYRRGQLEDVVRERRRAVADYWRKFPAAMRFLQDTVPEAWETISRCRMSYKYYRFNGVHDSGEWYKPVPFSCNQLPWCIHCVRAATSRRVNSTLDAFAECTPAGHESRYIGIVQTAPVFEDGRRGWGEAAYRDHGRFLGAIWKLLREAYGPGLGAHMSFQAFGERAFRKWHPHADLTLNGWRVVDGKAEKVPEYELKGGGRSRWNDLLIAAATEAFPGEDVAGTQRITKDLNILDVRVGHWSYYPILKYKVREMVDVRKIDYSREKRTVWWQNYEDGTRTAFTIEEFFSGIRTYQRLYGAWGSGSHKGLHRRYGHMADSNLNATAEAIGGQPIPHGRSCPCSNCQDWDRVFLDDVDRAVGPPRPVRL